MSITEKILFAHNELENVINGLQETMEMSEEEMMIVIEMLLSAARYKTLVRKSYNEFKKPEELKEEGAE